MTVHARIIIVTSWGKGGIGATSAWIKLECTCSAAPADHACRVEDLSRMEIRVKISCCQMPRRKFRRPANLQLILLRWPLIRWRTLEQR